jgi:hypothetical protein
VESSISSPFDGDLVLERREDGLICQWQPSAAYSADRSSGSLTYAQHLDSIDEHQATKMYRVRKSRVHQSLFQRLSKFWQARPRANTFTA